MARLNWQKSSFSTGTSNGECIEVTATSPNGPLLLRESARPEIAARTTQPTWSAFLTRIKSGAHDHPPRTR
jgi:hypothetical protein